MVNHQQSFVRFCVVGVINTLIDFGVFAALFYGAGWGLLVAHVPAFCAAVVNGFIMNKVWTFGDKSAVTGMQFGRFAAVAGIGLLISSAVVAGGSHVMPVLAAKALAVAAALMWNYAGSSRFVFRR
ncbi:MAG: GtrA family protein [Proteobacteria bacterium]|nr:GtrA family protein [Pseudomonadota bacterium]